MLRYPWEERQALDPKREEPDVERFKLQQGDGEGNTQDGQGLGTGDRKGTSCNVTQLMSGGGICQVRAPSFSPSSEGWQAAQARWAWTLLRDSGKLLVEAVPIPNSSIRACVFLYPPRRFSPAPEVKVPLSTMCAAGYVPEPPVDRGGNVPCSGPTPRSYPKIWSWFSAQTFLEFPE